MCGWNDPTLNIRRRYFNVASMRDWPHDLLKIQILVVVINKRTVQSDRSWLKLSVKLDQSIGSNVDQSWLIIYYYCCLWKQQGYLCGQIPVISLLCITQQLTKFLLCTYLSILYMLIKEDRCLLSCECYNPGVKFLLSRGRLTIKQGIMWGLGYSLYQVPPFLYSPLSIAISHRFQQKAEMWMDLPRIDYDVTH